MSNTFSIRTSLQGELQDFVVSSGFTHSNTLTLVRNLTCLLGSYREEDVPLFPEVFVLSSAADVAVLAPGTRKFPIGGVPLDEEAAATILKNCASLAVRGWAIYIAGTLEDQAKFGLFRALRHSFAAGAIEVSAQPEESAPLILVHNRGHLVVELRNAKQETFTAAFTSEPAAASMFEQHIQSLAERICSDLESAKAAEFVPYVSRLLLDQLQHCHGALLAVHVPTNTCPAELQDGVWLSDPLDLASAHAAAVDANDAESLATLQAQEALLSGMINSDGVVVFCTNGTVLGYHVFLKPKNAKERKTASHKGGGRRRTFELMRGRLGTKLRAAFFRSQDGQTACERSTP